MVCPSAERTSLFRKGVDELDKWMEDHHTEKELRKAIKIYLLGRGNRKFCAIWGLSPRMQRVARFQDGIGWRHFTEGKVTKEIRAVQEHHLRTRRTRLTADVWMKGFVGKLLQMTHSQWIFRCITKHHKTKGTKAIATQQDLLRAIERQLDMGLASVAPEDQWLLEIDQSLLKSESLKQQQYWLWAVEAARQAGS